VSHYIPEAGGDGEEVEEAVRTLVSPRVLSHLAGLAVIAIIIASFPILLIHSLANSVSLVNAESLLALVLAFGTLWRQFRTEARARHVERQQ
jgi:hypothetical protein